MKRTLPFVFPFLLFAGVLLSAQEASDAADAAPPYERYPEALGAAYGEITGTGLHYHRWMGTTGYSVAAGILYLPPSQAISGNVLDYNAGGGIQRRVFADSFAEWLAGSLYLFGGLQHRGYIPAVSSGGDPTSVSLGSFEAEVTAGGGIGIELILFEHFSFPSEFGYGATWTVTEPSIAEAILVQFYGQAAVRYRY
ncbi:MAG: hypothetical protein ACOC0O_05495 [Spirochaetota bacterium]